MRKSKDYISSIVFKYPYYGKISNSDQKDYLSEKICQNTIQIRKKIVKKMKLSLIYINIIIRINSAFAYQAINLPILPNNQSITRVNYSNDGLLKKQIIVQVQKDLSLYKSDFNKEELEKLYDFSIEFMSKPVSQKEIITKLSNLRGG